MPEIIEIIGEYSVPLGGGHRDVTHFLTRRGVMSLYQACEMRRCRTAVFICRGKENPNFDEIPDLGEMSV